MAKQLTNRALHHPKTQLTPAEGASHQPGPDEIRLTITRVNAEQVIYIPALSIEEVPATCTNEAWSFIVKRLRREETPEPVISRACTLARSVLDLRGAILLDVSSGTRIDPDPERGVRVSNLDAAGRFGGALPGATGKHHLHEAVVLASKVAHHPAILAEICISDDPDYTTGYLATGGVYYRIPAIKEAGSPQGTRVFLCDCGPQPDAMLGELIDYLENQPVLVADDSCSTPPSESPAKNAPMVSLDSLARQRNADWRAAGLERTQKVFSTAQLPVSTIDAESRVLLSSSNYLGLAHDPTMIKAAQKALTRFGTGSGGSRLTTGTTVWHTQVKRDFAAFCAMEDAVFFATGYQANLSALQALGRLTGGDIEVFSDQLNHASLIDGCRIGRLATTVYPHRDVAALRRALEKSSAAHKLILSDDVFSMDGTLAPLTQLRELADAFGAWLYIDDAHGTGTMGEHGHGTQEHFGVQADILVATASKALGAEGAAVCTNGELATYLRNHARSYIFSTATSAANCAAVSCALGLIDAQPQRVARLHHNIATVGHLLSAAGFPAPEGGFLTPIVPIHIGDENHALHVAQRLHTAGFHVPAIRYPTVARGEAILRVTVMSTLEVPQLEAFVDELERAVRSRET